MDAVLRAEAVRLRTTRSIVALLALVVGYPAAVAAVVATLPADDRADFDAGTMISIVRGVGDAGMVVTALAGALFVAGAYQHRTVVPMLLVAPDRRRLAIARIAVVAAAAGATALAASVVAISTGMAVLAANDVSVDLLSGQLLLVVANVVVVLAAFGALGAAVGFAVRNSVASAIGILVWFLVVEGAVPVVLRRPDLRQWLPGGAASGMLDVGAETAELLPPIAATTLLAGVVTVALTTAVVATVRTDVA